MISSPAIGGLFLFKDSRNFLHLEKGYFGAQQLSFKGFFQDRDRIIGRGYLPSVQTYLRLERRGNQVRALCSRNGWEWFSLGTAEFPVSGPLEAGLHAIGRIQSNIYGYFPDGSAIRFSSFQMER